MNHREALEKMVESGLVQIYFYTKHSEVLIPSHMTKIVDVLNFSKAFTPGGDADLLITKDGISQTLSFMAIQSAQVFVPFEAMIFVIAPAANTALLLDSRFESCVGVGNRMNTQEDMIKAFKTKCVEFYGASVEKKNPFTLLKGGKK